MERKVILKVVLVCLLVVSFILPVRVSAQQGRFRRGGLYGDWQIKMEIGEQQMESILAFSRNQEGNYVGQWINFWGMNELKDIKFEDNKLSFTQVFRFQDQEMTSKFTGTIEEGKLSGLMISDRGEMGIQGKRAPRPPFGISWEMKIQVGENEITGTLMIIYDMVEGNLSGIWKSSRGEGEVSDLELDYENRTLTFKRVFQTDNGQMEVAFEGTIGDGFNSLEGVFKSEAGEAAAEGTRVGASLIGTWNLDIESERGARKQRLRVNSDMSALYGPTLIKKINLDGDKVSFKYALQFGDQEFETSFEGKIVESKLIGELKTSRGTSKVTGTRRTFRRSR